MAQVQANQLPEMYPLERNNFKLIRLNPLNCCFIPIKWIKVVGKVFSSKLSGWKVKLQKPNFNSN